MVLAPLKVGQAKEEPEYGSDSPIVTCDNPDCKKQGPSHLMINLMLCVGSPGHPALPPFQCPGQGQIENRPEHWACSTECWLLVAHACIDEHMHELLKAHRSTVNL